MDENRQTTVDYLKRLDIQGFYDKKGNPCEYADNKQISATKYLLQQDLYYVTKSKDVYLIKKGFIHDGASKGPLRRFGTYSNAALLHDALYGSHLVKQNKADDLFLEAMEFSGVSWLTRRTYYSSVWLFGYFAYSGKTEVTIAKNKELVEIHEIR